MALPFGLWCFPGLSLLIISVDCTFHNNSDGFPLVYNVLTVELQGGGQSDNTTCLRLPHPAYVLPGIHPLPLKSRPRWVTVTSPGAQTEGTVAL